MEMIHMKRLGPGPGRHKYDKVPPNNMDSDSEDDEATLYVASSLKEHLQCPSEEESGFGINPNLNQSEGESLKDSNQQKRSIQYICAVIFILVFIAMILTGLLLLLNFAPTSSSNESLHWEKALQPVTIETTPEIHDVNRDGIKDILTVADTSPCQGTIMALSGADGSTLWKHPIQFPPFAIRCILDVNSDGVLDCLVSGRTGGFVALDSTDGSVLWYADASIVFSRYNFYFPVLLGDMDNDGIDDLINIHGGDPDYDSRVVDRSPGFLVAISGKTGQKLMEPILMPDGHESYSSPILFTMDSSHKFILFGSGGETIRGSLWAVELTSLRVRVKSQHDRFVASGEAYQINLVGPDGCMFDDGAEPNKPRPVMNTAAFNLSNTMSTTSQGLNCPTWADKRPLWNDYNVCLYEIVRGRSKGVILPPVVVDMTLDGVGDLVVSTYDGLTRVLDGTDMSTVVWDADYTGTESYSLPAPIFYTADDVPDLVIRTNEGEWPDYNISTLRVLDGGNGSLLWSFTSTLSGMMSAISILSRSHGQDALFFTTLGEVEVSDNKRWSKRSESRPFDEFVRAKRELKDEERVPRHAIIEDPIDPPDLWVSTADDPVPDPKDLDAMLQYCGMTKSGFTASVYMVTREMIESGSKIVPLASYEPFVYVQEGDIIANKDDSSDMDDDDDTGKLDPADLRCEHFSSPTALFTTPTLTDFNADKRLDITYIIVWESPYDAAFRALLVAGDLEELFVKTYGKEVLDFETFLPIDEQPWTQYMGKRGDSNFIPPKT